MDANLARLAECLGGDVTLVRLVDALFAIRAPRTLEGIVPVCRQFRDWRGAYPDLDSFPELTDYAERLALLDRIADLEIDDDHLMGRTIGRIRNPWTPLFTVTGDSVIGELLLVQARKAVDAAGFERASVWLLWQAQRFHTRFTTRVVYETYLTSKSGRLATHLPGRRLYEAYLALRSFADSDPATEEKLSSFLGFASEPTPARSAGLAWLFRLGTERLAQFDRLRLRQRAMERTGWSELKLTDEIDEALRVVPPGIGRLLTMLWLRSTPKATGPRWARREFFGRDRYRPQIIHGERLTQILQRVDADDVHAGTVVEFFPREPKRRRRRREREREGVMDDDPEEPSQPEPALSLFLADDRDLIRGWYASKGQQNGIEYTNALLRWSKWTLSRPAVNAVEQTVAEPQIAETRLDRYARLAIGLSLLTGRSLERVAGFRIAEESPDVNATVPVAVGLRTHVLYLYAGQPKLRRPPDASAPFCRPRTHVLLLALPERWRELVHSIGVVEGGPRDAITRRARRRLRALGGRQGRAPTLRVTERGVRYAVLRELDELTRGDLGARQVLTDGAEVDARNIIHYASYGVRRLESLWRKAAEALVGPLPDVDQRPWRSQYVGAQHAFDVPSLAQYFHSIQRRALVAQSRGDWPRLFNLMTLYLAYWLGLGVAGRRALVPAVPSVVLEDGWALVADKHRTDGSTDRLVPLTAGLRAQIAAYIAFASELSITAPKLDPIVHTDRGSELRLQYIRLTKGVVPYQPKYQEEAEQLTPLPANWGRKVLRSESGQLPGRFRDAEMGHWVRGRHAWDATSTFDAMGFHACWLALQERMEKRLRFKVIKPVRFWKTERLAPLHPVVTRASPPASATPAPEALGSKLDIVALLREIDPGLVNAVLEKDHAVAPEAALDLVRRAVEAQEREPVERQLQVAEAACTWVREQKKIALFATKPRPLFSNKVVLSADALQTLAYLQQRVLPKFLADLECLPPKPCGAGHVAGRPRSRARQESPGSSESALADPVLASTWLDAGAATGEAPPSLPAQLAAGRRVQINASSHAVELGRLAMVAIWRLGLARWTLIESWFRALHENAPVFAQGSNRYMVVEVKTDRSREFMQRTVFLDDFTSTYLVIDREWIRQALLAPLFRTPTPARRRVRVENAVQAYLRFLDAGHHRIPLTAMTAAAVQSVMLRSAPILAAYARGGLNTWDLGDGELRRLGGMHSVRRSGAASEPTLPDVNEWDIGDADLPGDLLRRVPLMRALGQHSSAWKSEWHRVIGQYKPASPAEQLLCNFALWLLGHGDTNSRATLSPHEKHYLTGRIKVIAYALLGQTSIGQERVPIDGDLLAGLQEATRDEFPDRLQHGAWFQFHRFLSDAKADHAGFAVGPLGPAPDRAVSAKILSAEELATVHAVMASVQSHIGNAALRASAQHHVELMATYGMRRAESAYLRTLDFQQDLCRVQAYGDHTLKTAWSDRVLPIGFAEPYTQAWIREACHRQYVRLIDPSADTRANPDNFFDAVNQQVKRATGDDSMGSHHLRHTLVSRLVLTLLWHCAGLERLAEDMPWLKGLVVDPNRMQVLLGTEGDAGQGMRAVSALVGHSHPTTTIRHYVHVLGIALHGALEKADSLDLSRSFENRIGGKSTLQRWVTQLRVQLEGGVDSDSRRHVVNRRLRDRIEQHFGWKGIDRDETPRALVEEEASAPNAITLARLEQVDQSFRDGQDRLDPGELETYRQGLQWLASIRTGKKGKRYAGVSRHPLEKVQVGVWLPRPLAAGSAVEAARALCAWLESLRATRPEDFAWLLDKWVHASEQERSRIRLTDAGEIERARSLEDPHVAIRIAGAIVPNVRVRLTTKPVPRMRIKCRDRQGRLITRDTRAVRWVMSYVAACEHVRRVAAACAPLATQVGNIVGDDGMSVNPTTTSLPPDDG